MLRQIGDIIFAIKNWIKARSLAIFVKNIDNYSRKAGKNPSITGSPSRQGHSAIWVATDWHAPCCFKNKRNFIL